MTNINNHLFTGRIILIFQLWNQPPYVHLNIIRNAEQSRVMTVSFPLSTNINIILVVQKQIQWMKKHGVLQKLMVTINLLRNHGKIVLIKNCLLYLDIAQNTFPPRLVGTRCKVIPLLNAWMENTWHETVLLYLYIFLKNK